MRFVHKKRIYSKFLKAYHMVLDLLVVHALNLIQKLFLFCLHLFYRPVFAFLLICHINSSHQLFHLCFHHCLLAFIGNRNPLELGMPHDHAVIIPRRNPGSQPPPVFFLKILFFRDQYLRIGKCPNKFRSHLVSQVVRHRDHRLGCNPQPPHFHAGTDHLNTFAGSHSMGQKGIPAR